MSLVLLPPKSSMRIKFFTIRRLMPFSVSSIQQLTKPDAGFAKCHAAPT